MIDDDDHSTSRFLVDRRHLRCGGFEQASQAGYFLDAQFSGMGTPEEITLLSDDEGELTAIGRLDLADPLKELESIAPMQTSRQLSMKQSLMKNLDLVV
jgi:hypothetical protein